MGRGMTWEVVHADCIEAMREMPENSVHAVVCDPPYDLTDVGRKFQGTGGSIDPRTNRERSERRNGGFMGMKWDATGIAFKVETWQEVFRVLRPGGYLLAFSGSRTYHRMAVAIEDAGFVLHPMLGWVTAQGFPKATNLSKQFDKRGENPSGWLDFAAAYDEAVKASAYTHSDIDRMLGIKSSSCYWARSDHRGGMPPRHHWERVRSFLDLPPEFERLYDEAEREVIGQDGRTANSSWLGTQDGVTSTWGIGEWDITARPPTSPRSGTAGSTGAKV